MTEMADKPTQMRRAGSRDMCSTIQSSQPATQLQLSGFERSGQPALFRPIHYIGSKLRVVDEISRIIAKVAPNQGAVCDLFAGSGTVSAALSRNRRVISVDIQEYSRVICSALLDPPEIDISRLADEIDQLKRSPAAKRLLAAAAPLIDYEARCLERARQSNAEPICDLLEHGSVIAYQLGESEAKNAELKSALRETAESLTAVSDSKSSTAIRYFGGIYFSYSQAVAMDVILNWIEDDRPDGERDSLVAALLSTASDVVNTVGKQFAQPIRPRTRDGLPKSHLVDKIQRDRSIDIFDRYIDWASTYQAVTPCDAQHSVVCGDYLDALSTLDDDISAIYADPPYTRDHYSRYYHVLETLCHRDDPTVSRLRVRGQEKISRGIYRLSRHQSPFCIRSQAPAAFAALFREVKRRQVPLVLSYSPDTTYKGSRPRVMSIDNINEIAERYFRDVAIASLGSVSHNRLNSSEKTLGKSENAEVAFVCTP